MDTDAFAARLAAMEAALGKSPERDTQRPGEIERALPNVESLIPKDQANDRIPMLAARIDTLRFQLKVINEALHNLLARQAPETTGLGSSGRQPMSRTTSRGS